MRPGRRGHLEARELLTSNLALIERTIAFACRRHRLDAGDAEEFSSTVMLRLVENDYAILRAFEERSSFATFISIVIQRMALDYRIHTWGKWHSSAEAKRLGALAVDLEKLLHRDGRSLDDALVILRARHPDATRTSLEALAARLPERAPRRHDVQLDEAQSVAASGREEVEERVLAADRERVSQRLSAAMATLLEQVPDDERLVLQLRYEGGMTVPQIARMLRLDQKLLYRQIERRMRQLRGELERSGVAPDDALDLIGRDGVVLQFQLGNRKPRPSIERDETLAPDSEVPQ